MEQIDYIASRQALKDIEAEFKRVVAEKMDDKTRRQGAACIKGCEAVIKTAYIIQDMMEEFNEYKAVMDKAHKENNVELFTEYYNKFMELFYRVNVSKVSGDLKKRSKFLNVIRPLRMNIYRKISFIYVIREAGEIYIKDSKRTPAQRAAVSSARVRMRRKWAEIV